MNGVIKEVEMGVRRMGVRFSKTGMCGIMWWIRGEPERDDWMVMYANEGV